MDRNSAAVFLQTETQALLTAWAERVRAHIPATRHFDSHFLLLRFDDLIAELAAALSDPSGGPDRTPRVPREISQFRTGYLGYTSDQIVRELQLLRRTLLDSLSPYGEATRSAVEDYFDRADLEAIRENCRITREATNADATVLETILDQARCILLSAEVSREEGVNGPHLVWVPLRYGVASAERVLPLDLAPGEDFFAAWRRLRHPPENAAFQKAIEDMYFLDGDFYSQEFSVTDRFGQAHWLREEVSVQSVEANRWRLVGVIIDITDRMRAEEELREADRQKDLFLAMLAHELRNPLAPVRNAVYLLNMKGSGDPALRRATEIIERQVAHMARMVDDLLDASRIKREKVTLKKERLDLIPLLRHTLENVRPLAESKGQHLHACLPSEPMVLDADPARLDQVFGNLLDNAVKYTPQGGEIGLVAERDGGEAVVRVRDTGQGIGADILPHVFDLFTQADHTLDRAQGGLGLGLSIVKGLVEQHGGGITVHSEGEGRGSEFTVRLPHPAWDGDPAPASNESARKVREVRRRILLVEDNPDAAETLKGLLETCGHEVRVVHDGLDAVPAADEHRPDVILLDIGLPGMDGHAIAVRLRERPEYAGVKIIAITGYERGEEGDSSHPDAFSHYLLKPVDFHQLQGLLLPDQTDEIPSPEANGASLPAAPDP